MAFCSSSKDKSSLCILRPHKAAHTHRLKHIVGVNLSVNTTPYNNALYWILCANASVNLF